MKKKKKKKKKKKGKKGKKGKKEPEEENPGWRMPPSKFLTPIKEGHDKYLSVWENRDEKRVEVESELRLQVDEIMREELANLKIAVDRQKKAKKGKKKKKKKKKKKGKKRKKT